MDALILSCGTGGGHNAAGNAIKEELCRRGHNAVLLDPYSLAGKNVDKAVGGCYIKIAQKSPHVFGLIYELGDCYRRLPIHSPVYDINKLMSQKMQSFLTEHHVDVVIMPHIFPAEILTCMKNKGIPVPITMFVATDYTCIPFTEETDCDYYVIPSEKLKYDFLKRGIQKSRLLPMGIPVSGKFLDSISKEDAKAALGLDVDIHYFLLSGGSIGAGKIRQSVGLIAEYMRTKPDNHLIVICGNNKKLRQQLEASFINPQITILSSTDCIHLYMRACDIFLSKPGGLSSTEAAAIGIPLIHLAPIPGCENSNLRFFSEHGMSIPVGDNMAMLIPAMEYLQSDKAQADMIASQKHIINANAASDICDFIENIL